MANHMINVYFRISICVLGYYETLYRCIFKEAEEDLRGIIFRRCLTMNEHMKLSDMPEMCSAIKEWLSTRYGTAEGIKIWEKTSQQYNEYLKELPDYGGKKSSHAFAIYGGVVIFSLYPLLPDQAPIEEIQEFVTSLFMGAFVKLGKVFNLNRNFDMWMINKVFQKVGKKDRKQFEQYPASFCNISEPYDKKNHAARYHFSQCPNAEFAKKYNLMHVLPLFCNSDYWGISQIHGTLIRCGTCGNSDKCDYCVVGSENPMAKEYEIVKDEAGFLVSKKKKYV